LTDGIERELLGRDCPSVADELAWGEAIEGLEPTGVVVGVDEVGEIAFDLVMRVVAMALDGNLLDRAVHSLDVAALVKGCLGMVSRCATPC
jgi:hypothetical protein